MRQLVGALVLLFLSISCRPSGGISFFEVTTYNAYSFFDSRNDGTEFEGFRQRDGYDGEAYQKRVKETAILLGKLAASSDVIILEEIESIDVLADLLDNGLSGKGFRYYGLAESGDSLSVGFLSKAEPMKTAVHSFSGCRPILELLFIVSGERIRVFGVHFKSRLDGGEDQRYEEACHLRTLIETGDGLAIVAGDFNTDPRYSERSMAIYPDSYDASRALHVATDPSKAGSGVYYCPLLDSDAVLKEKGTYSYKGEWFFYDGFLLSEEAWNAVGWEYHSVDIPTLESMKDRAGRPLAYDVSLERGYSDHFPATVILRK